MDGTEAYHQYVRDFMSIQYPAGDVPLWAVDALATADIHIETTLTTHDAAPAATAASTVPVTDEADGADGAAAATEEQAEKVTPAAAVRGSAASAKRSNAKSGYKRKLPDAAGAGAV